MLAAAGSHTPICMSNYIALALPALKLGLDDLLSKRRADLVSTKTGKYYEDDLKEMQSAINNLPAALTGGTPLAAELDAADGEHDGYGGFLHDTTTTYERLPGADPAILEAGRRIRAAFIPTPTELSASYAVEAHRARERRPLLKTHKADLQQFPIAGRKGATLFDVATGFLDAGEKLDALLSRRADVPAESRKAASTLRPSTVGLLNKVRADLAKEMRRNPALPRDLDQRLFGYFDTLEAMAIQAAAARAKDIADKLPPPSPDTTDTTDTPDTTDKG